MSSPQALGLHLHRQQEAGFSHNVPFMTQVSKQGYITVGDFSQNQSFE
jgi:hypothetical protein